MLKSYKLMMSQFPGKKIERLHLFKVLLSDINRKVDIFFFHLLTIFFQLYFGCCHLVENLMSGLWGCKPPSPKAPPQIRVRCCHLEDTFVMPALTPRRNYTGRSGHCAGREGAESSCLPFVKLIFTLSYLSRKDM